MIKTTFIAALGAITMASCCCQSTETAWLDSAIEQSAKQLAYLANESKDAPVEKCFPRTIKNGETVYITATDWTSGFFPGNLWLGYKLTDDDFLAQEARKYTNRLEEIKNFRRHHDTGFMIYCSYGWAEQLRPEPTDKDIIITTANTLATRYTDEVGAIRSWDFGVWSYPVIIDNMMNLELMFWAAEESGNDRLREIAINHADKTLKHHFRDDATSYHVVSYNPESGEVESKGTHQGYSDDSAWARGQAWGIYGYTLCYRFTKDEKYLAQAERIAKFIMDNKPAADDFIPYWDYNDPEIPNVPRDASAAAVTASAMLELQGYAADGEKYFDFAENILKQLSSEEYLAEVGANNGFLLYHSTGYRPKNLEVDVPLNYADYYYLEALSRYKDLLK